MLSEWLKLEAAAGAEQLMRYNQVDRSPIGGYGMKRRVQELIRLLRTAMYPSVYYEGVPDEKFLEAIVAQHWQEAAMLLYQMACDVLRSECPTPGQRCQKCQEESEQIVKDFIASLPLISQTLDTDIQAAYEGDPAARSREEVMLAYPAFEAISIFRLAHRLFELNLPLIPRMMTEYAHQITGIDIHPGAHIGPHFFIDHGTGVVIGETCRIGHHVKLYQGVTLGAKSFQQEEDGSLIKGGKRHPDVGNHVVIYAGATVLGGGTVVGDHSVIGGSVWLTHSVPAGSKIYNR